MSVRVNDRIYLFLTSYTSVECKGDNENLRTMGKEENTRDLFPPLKKIADNLGSLKSFAT